MACVVGLAVYLKGRREGRGGAPELPCWQPESGIPSRLARLLPKAGRAGRGCRAAEAGRIAIALPPSPPPRPARPAGPFPRGPPASRRGRRRRGLHRLTLARLPTLFPVVITDHRPHPRCPSAPTLRPVAMIGRRPIHGARALLHDGRQPHGVGPQSRNVLQPRRGAGQRACARGEAARAARGGCRRSRSRVRGGAHVCVLRVCVPARPRVRGAHACLVHRTGSPNPRLPARQRRPCNFWPPSARGGPVPRGGASPAHLRTSPAGWGTTATSHWGCGKTCWVLEPRG